MKFLVDAQLPRRMAAWLVEAGHEAIHTLDLPNQNRTSDADICELADLEQRVVITKDSDFVDSHLIGGQPARLWLISTGNLTNLELASLLIPTLAAIVQELETNFFIELGTSGVIVRS